MKGSYILLIKLPEHQALKIGSRKAARFPAGYYAYVGSAMGGFRARLSRHLRKNKRPRWHIDYLLAKASISDIILCETDKRIECLIAQAIGTQFESMPGFGSSDCRCHSHLFSANDGEHMLETIMATLHKLAIQPIEVRIEEEILNDNQGEVHRIRQPAGRKSKATHTRGEYQEGAPAA